MDRLVKVDEQELSISFKPNHRSSTTVRLTNLMHTMSVAVALTTTSPSLFTISPQPLTVLPPLSSSLFSLSLTTPSSSPPLSSPPHSLLVRTSMLPTGKAPQDDLRRLFSKPGLHIFKDATLPISFVGQSVVEFLLSSTQCMQTSVYLSKAISTCSPLQLTSLLRSAVERGNSVFVSALIDAGADVNATDSDGLSMMSYAVRSSNLEVVRILKESGCRIDDWDELFLHDAAAMNRIDLIKILLKNSVDQKPNPERKLVNSVGPPVLLKNSAQVKNSVTLVNSVDRKPDPVRKLVNSVGSPGLFKKSVNSVDQKPDPLRKLVNSVGSQLLMKKSANSINLGDQTPVSVNSGNIVDPAPVPVRNSGNLVNSVDSVGRTPVHVSAFHGHIDVLKLCVSMGGDPDRADLDGWTPLHCAAAQGHTECIEYLIECSIYSKYSINKDGKTPFLLAMDNGHSNLLEMLRLGDVLCRAARVDDVNGMKSCIEEGTNVNARDQNGWTPLHRAAFKGRIECVKVLLSHGAKTDVVDDVGYSPLHCAIEAGHVEVALCLIANGALASSKTLKGVCSLNLDRFKNHPAFVSPMQDGKELV